MPSLNIHRSAFIIYNQLLFALPVVPPWAARTVHEKNYGSGVSVTIGVIASIAFANASAGSVPSTNTDCAAV